VRIIKALEDLGLSTYEAKAYLALSSEDPLTGYKLSKSSEVPRSRIYETIEKLIRKGLVVTLRGKKNLIKAVDLEHYLENREKESKETLAFIRQAMPQIKSTIEDQGIWNLSGRSQILDVIAQLIAQTKNHIYMQIMNYDFIELMESFIKAKKRKVKVLGIHCGELDNKFGDLLLHQGDFGSACSEIAMSFDSKEALVGCTLPSETASVAFTRSRGIISVVDDYVKHEIFISQFFTGYEKASLDAARGIYHKMMAEMP
jgi:sugar-specific transcriptional regulator TrmB